MNAPNDQQVSRDNGKDNPAGTPKLRSVTVKCVARLARYQTLAGGMSSQSENSGTTEHTGEPAGKKKTAVFIAHGMGQQLPYDTQTKLALKLRNHLKLGPESLLRTRQVLIGDQRYSRIEFDLPAADGKPEREVHVYEAYWAPLTEGEVRIRDVTGFLFRAGWNGLRHASKPLRRWLFDRPVECETGAWLKAQIILALLFVSSLVLLNATIGLVVATRFLGDGESSDYWSDDRIAALSGALVPLLAVSVLLFLWFFVRGGFGHWLKPSPLKPVTQNQRACWVCGLSASPTQPSPPKPTLTQRAWAFLGLLLFRAAVAVTLLTGLAFVWLLTDFSTESWPVEPRQLTAWARQYESAFRRVEWLLLFGISYFVRRQMVQYLGDVVIYLSTHVVDRFEVIREKIRARVRDALSAVFLAAENKQWVYERVVVVGHSLGSVASYDALNELLLQDSTDGPLKVKERTAGFVTFGSPLDKIAYFFTSRSNLRSEDEWNDARQALGAAKQPMTSDAGVRTFPWVNIHARRDIIAGKLDYYDDPIFRIPESPVNNVEDEHAITPLLAHNEYWEGPTLYREIAAML